MPLYEFHCEKCDSDFERLVRILDKDMVLTGPCPNCNEEGGIVSKLSTPPLIDSVRLGVKKPPTAVTEKLNDIKKSMYKSNMTGGKLV